MFAIDKETGEITVSGNGVLDFETTPSFSFTVRVRDNENNVNGNITITLSDESGSCTESEIITALPYEHTGSTGGRNSLLNEYGEMCGEEQYTTPEFVYALSKAYFERRGEQNNAEWGQNPPPGLRFATPMNNRRHNNCNILRVQNSVCFGVKNVDSRSKHLGMFFRFVKIVLSNDGKCQL